MVAFFEYVSLFPFPSLFYGMDRLCSVSDFFSVLRLLGLSFSLLLFSSFPWLVALKLG